MGYNERSANRKIHSTRCPCKEIGEAREDIKKAHQEQTEIIQKEAAGEHYKTCLLFTHAQDTLMTIMSEVNLTEKMIILFESFYQIQGHKEN